MRSEQNDTCELCMYVTERLGESTAGLPVSVTWYCSFQEKDLKPDTPVCHRYRWGERKYQALRDILEREGP